LAWIRSQVDLDAVGLHDPEETQIVAKRYSRSGLSLVRSEEPDVNGFHALRSRAIDAIAGLALAMGSAPAAAEALTETPVTGGAGAGSSAWSSILGAVSPSDTKADDAEAAADAPVVEDDPSEEPDGAVVLLPEPSATATGVAAALALALLARTPSRERLQ
ncbi:MAG: hypothetical protein VCC02_01850, partial [Myxococcota bacterium]